MTLHKTLQFTRSLFVVLAAFTFMGCKKAEVAPVIEVKAKPVETVPAKTAAPQTDSLKTVSNDPTDTTNPQYWYNGTSGPALISVSCKDCTAIAKIGDTTVPFMFNDEGIGYLKYTPKSGLSIYIAVCPTGPKAVNVDIFDTNKSTLFNYSGVITANWLNTFVIK